jgi:hypothetical protein
MGICPVFQGFAAKPWPGLACPAQGLEHVSFLPWTAVNHATQVLRWALAREQPTLFGGLFFQRVVTAQVY